MIGFQFPRGARVPICSFSPSHFQLLVHGYSAPFLGKECECTLSYMILLFYQSLLPMEHIFHAGQGWHLGNLQPVGPSPSPNLLFAVGRVFAFWQDKSSPNWVLLYMYVYTMYHFTYILYICVYQAILPLYQGTRLPLNFCFSRCLDFSAINVKFFPSPLNCIFCAYFHNVCFFRLVCPSP